MGSKGGGVIRGGSSGAGRAHVKEGRLAWLESNPTHVIPGDSQRYPILVWRLLILNNWEASKISHFNANMVN